MAAIEKTVKAEGHLIDSGLMRQIFDIIIADGGSFDILDFKIGRNNDEYSSTRLKISADDPAAMNSILLKLSSVGCTIDREEEVRLGSAPADGVVPPDFYSTTNHATSIRHGGRWLEVENIRMDGVIVVNNSNARVKKFRDICAGEMIVLGLSGVRVRPEFVERDRSDFSFMSGEVSSERKVQLAVDRAAELIADKSKKVAAVAGPVVVHTGGSSDLAHLI